MIMPHIDNDRVEILIFLFTATYVYHLNKEIINIRITALQRYFALQRYNVSSLRCTILI